MKFNCLKYLLNTSEINCPNCDNTSAIIIKGRTKCYNCNYNG